MKFYNAILLLEDYGAIEVCIGVPKGYRISKKLHSDTDLTNYLVLTTNHDEVDLKENKLPVLMPKTYKSTLKYLLSLPDSDENLEVPLVKLDKDTDK